MTAPAALPQHTYEKIRQLIYFQDHMDRAIEIVFGDRLTDGQRKLAQSLSLSDKVAAHTAHGVGKTFTAARLGLIFLFTQQDPKVITTAPTKRQVEDNLWGEIHAAMKVADLSKLHWDGKYRLLRTRLELSASVFMTGETSNDPRKMEGYHAPSILYIVDEAKAVDDTVFDSIEGALTSGAATGGRSARLYISTPGECSGKHYRICTGEEPGWSVVHISGEGQQRPDPAWVEEYRRVQGQDSFLYRTRVMGEFDPRGGDLVISPEVLGPAFRTRQEPLGHPEIGVDVAREGEDRTVICVRRGACVLSLVDVNNRDVTQVARMVEKVADALAVRYHIGWNTIRIKVDDGGVGGGVTDILRKKARWKVVAVKASASPYDPEHYKIRRDELWFGLAEKLKRGEIDLTRVPLRLKKELEGELCAPRWQLSERDQFMVEPTKKIKKRLKRSPDLAMGVILAFAQNRATGGRIGDLTRMIAVKTAPEKPKPGDPLPRSAGFMLLARGKRSA